MAEPHNTAEHRSPASLQDDAERLKRRSIVVNSLYRLFFAAALLSATFILVPRNELPHAIGPLVIGLGVMAWGLNGFVTLQKLNRERSPQE